jgi:predicted membrane protein
MPPEPRSVITPRFVLGFFLVLMGIALTLDQLGVVPAHHLMRFWPAILIVLGLSMLQRSRKRGALSGVLLIIVGTWLLLNTLGLVSLRLWEFLWPLVLVVIGARIMMRNHARSASEEPPRIATASTPPSMSAAPGVSDHVSQFALLSSCRRRWGSATFGSADVTCVLGGCELDLREALIGADGTAEIDAFVLMGGINVFVPPNWTVVTQVTPLLGGVEDKTRSIPASPARRLIVRGTVIMGGIEISN